VHSLELEEGWVGAGFEDSDGGVQVFEEALELFFVAGEGLGD